jgi:Cu(I)/Ag(I) efflux system membrane fusion protein
VEFTTESAPGETFAGRIAFLDPVLNEMTRTVKVRVNVKNDAGRLKPGMFVRASVEARVAASGRVMAPDLAGRWICPMHPEEVKNAAGECGSCGMPLVRTESLGYAPATEDERETPLVIPATAPLVTGERAVVYVQAEAADRPTFEGREVVLGPRAGDYYLVRAGLREGERVVTQGNFKIDSALQIQAKPSMMNPETSAEPRETPRPPTPKQDANEGGRGRLRDTLAAYLALHKALSRDDAKAAAVAVDPLRKAVEVAGTAPPSEPDRAAWAKVSADLSAAVRRVQTAKGIEEMRAGFSLLSEALAAAVRRFGAPGDGPVYVVHCPMAFNDRGADWLQSGPEVENPYFGAAMFRCGVVKETIQPPARGGKAHELH